MCFLMHINIWTPFTPSILIKYFSHVQIQLHAQHAYGCKRSKVKKILKFSRNFFGGNLDLLFETLVELGQGQTRALHDHMRTFLDFTIGKIGRN